MIWLLAFISTIFAANLAIDLFGVVPVGFGLMAPAAVYVVGLAFTLRDMVQRTLGARWVIFAIAAGAALSVIASPQLALASGVAFLVSESLDFAVYTPLRERNWPLAVAASNAVGIVVDSLIFLTLAFGSLEYLPGQVVGKAWMTLAAITAITMHRAVLARNA